MATPRFPRSASLPSFGGASEFGIVAAVRRECAAFECAPSAVMDAEPVDWAEDRGPYVIRFSVALSLLELRRTLEARCAIAGIDISRPMRRTWFLAIAWDGCVSALLKVHLRHAPDTGLPFAYIERLPGCADRTVVTRAVAALRDELPIWKVAVMRPLGSWIPVGCHFMVAGSLETLPVASDLPLLALRKPEDSTQVFGVLVAANLIETATAFESQTMFELFMNSGLFVALINLLYLPCSIEVYTGVVYVLATAVSSDAGKCLFKRRLTAATQTHLCLVLRSVCDMPPHFLTAALCREACRFMRLLKE